MFSHSFMPRVALSALLGLLISCGRAHVKSPSASRTTRDAGPQDDRPRQDGSAPSLEPVCETTPTVICYQDTARVVGAGSSDYPLANWIWFATAGDSIEVSVNPPATIETSVGGERDSLGNT